MVPLNYSEHTVDWGVGILEDLWASDFFHEIQEHQMRSHQVKISYKQNIKTWSGGGIFYLLFVIKHFVSGQFREENVSLDSQFSPSHDLKKLNRICFFQEKIISF